MAVDRDLLKQIIHEAAAGDPETAAYLEQKLAANEGLAANFTGLFLRNKDYTQKTQTLADERRMMESQLEQYRAGLEAAEAEKARIQKEASQHKLDAAQAWTRLKHLKETYQLGDDEIPQFSDVIKSIQTGRPVDSSNPIDLDSRLDARLAAHKKEIEEMFARKLIPELNGMARLDVVWPYILEEHKQLNNGNVMTAKQADELLTEAQKRNAAGRTTSLQSLWEEKYDVPALRQKYHDGELEKTLRAKWDAEQQAKISEQAMQGIRPTGAEQTGFRTSNIFDHKFKVHETEATAPTPEASRQTASAAERQSLTGAERAGKLFLERRAAGIPMGGPDARKPGGGKAA